MKPYSKDLRLKALPAVDHGMPRGEAAEVFGLSFPSIEGWLKLRRESDNVERRPVPGPAARKGAVLEAPLPSQTRENPDATLEEHREAFVRAGPRAAGVERLGEPSAQGAGTAAQKRSPVAAERDDAERARWREGAGLLDPHWFS